MSRKYKFLNADGLYFISFATVGWIDVFTRKQYKDILVESLRYCQQEKGLELFSWCIMSNHVHLIARAKEGSRLPDILRDYKKYTAKLVLKAIEDHPQESRKEWMLSFFKQAGAANSNNTTYQFWRQDNKPIELWSHDVILQELPYIHNNPVELGIVDKAEAYVYSSDNDYSYYKHNTELHIVFLEV